jgi:hypothetical protein
MRRRLTWNEISERYLYNWVALLDYDWPDKDLFPVAGVVRFHAYSKQELDRLLGKHLLPDAAVIFVDQYEPGRLWTWDRIAQTYPDEWVEVTKFDWPEGEAVPRTAVVTAHAKSSGELMKVSKSGIRYSTRHVCVADPGQQIQIIFWANKHLWESGLQGRCRSEKEGANAEVKIRPMKLSDWKEILRDLK